MYPEFVPIYIGLVITIGLLVAILILLLKKTVNNSKPTNYVANQNNFEATAPTGGSIVFCKKCAAQFDSTQKICPKCGTPR